MIRSFPRPGAEIGVSLTARVQQLFRPYFIPDSSSWIPESLRVTRVYNSSSNASGRLLGSDTYHFLLNQKPRIPVRPITVLQNPLLKSLSKHLVNCLLKSPWHREVRSTPRLMLHNADFLRRCHLELHSSDLTELSRYGSWSTVWISCRAEVPPRAAPARSH